MFVRKKRLFLLTGLLLLISVLAVSGWEPDHYDSFGMKRKFKRTKTGQKETITVGEGLYSINALFGEEIANEIPEGIGENEKIDGKTLMKLLKRLNMDAAKERVFNSRYGTRKSFTRSQWKEVLSTLARAFQLTDTIAMIQISVFMVQEQEKMFVLVTDDQIYSYYQLEDPDLKNDTTIVAMARNQTILFACEIKKEPVIYENVLIKDSKEEQITVTLKGCQRFFVVEGLEERLQNVTADLSFDGEKVTGLQLKREMIRGKILSVTEETLEIEGYGSLPVSKKCRYYRGFDDKEPADRFDVSVGNNHMMFVVADKMICSVIWDSGEKEKNIRVLLKSTGYTSLFHDQCQISCPGRLQMTYFQKDENGELEEKVICLENQQPVLILPGDEKLVNGRLTIKPLEEQNLLQLDSIMRNGKHPSYRGELEISVYEEKLVVINELPLEQYLYAVVPSEMPSGYGVEALKVQAVCARSYAISHLSDQHLGRYGAQVDDSTDYQVYNNTAETENAVMAVKETAGEILKYGETIANTYFFMTSCGSTTDATIWGDNGLPYIKGKLLTTKKPEEIQPFWGDDQDDSTDRKQYPDLTKEEVFREFIRQDVETFDSQTPWYRWQLTMTLQQLSDRINQKLPEICEKYPDQIQIRQQDGSFVSGKIMSIGKIKRLIPEKRLTGGVLDSLLIEGEAGMIRVLKQSVIRNLISPRGIPIRQADGNQRDQMTALPSAFFTVEQEAEKIVFYGGGYGHGAGMSQTAVSNMIRNGMNYREILKFFYSDVEIGIYD